MGPTVTLVYMSRNDSGSNYEIGESSSDSGYTHFHTNTPENDIKPSLLPLAMD